MARRAAPKIADPKAQAALENHTNGFGTAVPEHPALAQLRTIVPFDQYSLSGLDYPELGVGGGVMLATDMPKGFIEGFFQQGLFRADPISRTITASQKWASWHDLSAHEQSRPELQPIKLLEKTFSIATRSVVGFFQGPFQYGGATFTRATPFTADEKLILESVARLVHADLSSRYFTNMNQHLGLSSGELACLSVIASGASLDIASKTTGYTDQTVTSYIKAAVKKLNAQNRTHAVAEALRRRLIF